MKILSLVVVLLIFAGCESSKAHNSAGVTLVDGPGTVVSDQVTDTSYSYYAGTQSIGLTNTVPCYAELRFSEDQTRVDMRAILVQPHMAYSDISEAQVGVGVTLQQKFLGGSIQANGYMFEDPTPGAPVKQAIIMGSAGNPVQEIRAALLHDGHHDPVRCVGLQLATEDQVESVKQHFDHFEEFVENLTGHPGDDHDHEH